METTVYRVWAPLGISSDGRRVWIPVSVPFADRDEAEEWAGRLNDEHRVDEEEG